MHYGDIPFKLTIAFYSAACVLYVWALMDKSGVTNRASSILAACGLGAQGIGIVARGIQVHRVPLTNLFEALTFTAWTLMVVYLAMERRHRIKALGAFVSLVVLIATASASALPKDVSPSLVPALQSHWRSIHVVSSLVAYASFVLAFGATIGYMLQERLLKAKRISIVQQHLPSLDSADHLAYKMVALGFPMLTLGVVTGALWAESAWGSYWNWDPKETWSLITWLVYAAYLHVRVVQGWRGKWANRLLIVGLGSVIVTFFGVGFLPNGLHKYYW